MRKMRKTATVTTRGGKILDITGRLTDRTRGRKKEDKKRKKRNEMEEEEDNEV